MSEQDPLKISKKVNNFVQKMKPHKTEYQIRQEEREHAHTIIKALKEELEERDFILKSIGETFPGTRDDMLKFRKWHKEQKDEN